jgi:hypothetical protein
MSDDFDAACADKVVGLLGTLRDKVDADPADVDLVTRLLWTLGQVPPINDAAQAERYGRQLVDVLARRVWPFGADPAALGAFVRTSEGALAVALISRIEAWNGRASERH